MSKIDDLHAALTREQTRATQLEARVAELTGALVQTRAELQEAEHIKDDFLATLSHELRTPLNSILGWIQLLRLHLADKVEREHALDVVERNARAQVRIVNDLLDTSRVVTGRMRLTFEEVALDELVVQVTDALRPAASAKDIELNVDAARLPAPILGDSARLRQIVWNLISNAVKFTPVGGEVKVTLRSDDDSAHIHVTDTGIGMGGDVVPHVFERFSQGDGSLTRAFGGLGLGLAIVRHLVELHGGSVDATSPGANRGSTFSIHIPFRRARKAHGRDRRDPNRARPVNAGPDQQSA